MIEKKAYQLYHQITEANSIHEVFDIYQDVRDEIEIHRVWHKQATEEISQLTTYLSKLIEEIETFKKLDFEKACFQKIKELQEGES